MESSKEFCNVSKNVHCGKVIADECAGELICGKCGVVLEEKIPSSYKNQ
jgi:transcription initiation factor TFIIIB Brf1 subunit/transcription initiation factor TFIIB